MAVKIGSRIQYTNVASVAPAHHAKYDFKNVLQQLEDEYNGMDIFNEENALRLNKALSRLDNRYSRERDALLVANKCSVIQRLVASVNSPQLDKVKVLREGQKELRNNGVGGDIADELLAAFSLLLYKADLLSLLAEKEKTPSNVQNQKKEFPKKEEDSKEEPIDDQDLLHWKADKFFRNVFSSKKFKDADLRTKEQLRREAKEEAKLIKGLLRDAGLGGRF